MNPLQLAMLAVFLLASPFQEHAMAIEEAAYTVLREDKPFELRQYEAQVLAETIVTGSIEDAGGKAFKRLFRYISGNNRTQQKVAMTSPVGQTAAGEKIAMTTPVGQRRATEGWAVSFMMPARFTLESLPEPEDPRVTLRAVPARTVAAVRYTGFWRKQGYEKNRAALEGWLEEQGLRAAGDPIWAKYDPPFMPWFLRRNEILIPVAEPVPAE